ncbi:hypothetical protein [Jatrophihabitans endophyticus]|uniref:hypothetical protein n=1 Tax=Jatrophihabitans endophyticus TaxID=1206085 RepID=UPI001A0C9D64|nr:hypothetical protein [Jatrophihabitans endophyticus]MBE7190440.1 hypothetical protein [Jatrophihabitans endophyticus]
MTAAVTSITHGTDHDRGPGAATGRPTVLFHLRLSNGTSAAVSVADVQVLAAYGSSQTPAIAASSATHGFTGSVRPGHSADAVYAFAVPAAGQGSVALTVTYTASQPTVLLRGSAR